MNLSCVSGITEPGVFPDPECGGEHAAVIKTMDKAHYKDDHGTGQRTDGLPDGAADNRRGRNAEC